MPFTLAHPAAIIPLHKIMGRRVSISALVIGSMAPDFSYLLPVIPGALTHSLWGLLVFCFPAGLIGYFIFHLFLKRPMVTLLPGGMSYRLSQVVFEGTLLPRVSFWVVGMSVVLGACTHIAWDAFTHGSAAMVQKFEILRTVVGTVGEYKIYLFKILQHLSTFIGLTALGWWIVGWVKAHPVNADNFETPSLAASVRGLIVGCILVVGVVSGVVIGISSYSVSFERSLFHAVVAGIVGITLSAIAFSLGWHAYFSDGNQAIQSAINRNDAR